MAQAVETPETLTVASGQTDAFATVWTFERADEVRASVRVDGVTLVMANGEDFDLSAGDWLNDGADVIFRPGRRPPEGAQVRLWRQTVLAQAYAFGDQERFSPEANERAFDRLTRVAQEQARDVERAAGGDPEMIADAVAEQLPAATAGLAKRAGDTFSGRVGIRVDPETADEALNAGSAFAALRVDAPQPMETLDLPAQDLFQDIPRPQIILRLDTDAYGAGDADNQTRDPDLDLTRLGIGKFKTGRHVVITRTFGMRDNTTGRILMTNAPVIEEINTNPTQKALGDPQAAVWGVIPPPVIGWYPDIDQVGDFIRTYGTRDLPFAVSHYTADSVVFVDPIPEDFFAPLTSAIVTQHPEHYRGLVKAISEDRRTWFVYGWWKKVNFGDPQPVGEVPAPGVGLYLNVFEKMFPQNIVGELLGPIFERVRDIEGQSPSDGRLAWRTAGGAFIPYGPGEGAATKPAAAGAGAKLTHVQPANFQHICFTEKDSVNSKGPIDYKGDGVNPFDGSPVYGHSGLKNFAAGEEWVNGNGAYVDTETGQMLSGDSGFGYRVRGLFKRGFVARDTREIGFVVENGFLNLARGFVFEPVAGDPYVVDSHFKGVSFKVTHDGSMQHGQQKVVTNTASPYFAGRPHQTEVFTNGGLGANVTTYRHIVRAGDGLNPYSARSEHYAFTHEFRDQGLDIALRVSTIGSLVDDSFLDVRRGIGRAELRALTDSGSGNANLCLTTQGAQGRLEIQSSTAGYPIPGGVNTTPQRLVDVIVNGEWMSLLAIPRT